MLLLLPLLLACQPDAPAEDDPLKPYAEALDAAAAPAAQDDAEGVSTFTYDPEDGPVCLRGEPYRVAARDQGSEDLIVFLQGGGACWDGFCFAIAEAPPGIPGIDVLDTEDAENPVAGWNQVYLPYCDGSLFVGDAAFDDDGDGLIDRHQRGLANLSAGLTLAAERHPSPRRVLLAGSSGGGYGSILGALMARVLWPDAPLYVFNDSGPGVADGADPDFLWDLVEEWEAEALLPEACEGCFDAGHLTPLIGWSLDRDPNMKVAMFSSYGDAILSEMFLGVGEAGFRPELEAQVGALMADHPERLAAFLIEGRAHTSLIGEVEHVVPDVPDAIADLLELGSMHGTVSGGVSVGAWLEAFVEEDASWGSIVE